MWQPLFQPFQSRETFNYISFSPLLKGNQGKDASWLEDVDNVRTFPSASVKCWFCQYSYQRKTGLVSNVRPSGHGHAGSLFTNEEHLKRMACDVFDTLATHASLVRDVTDTEHKMAAPTDMFG